MNRRKLGVAALLGLVLAIAGSAQAQQLDVLSPEDLILRLERDKEPGGSRGGQACAIAPQPLTMTEASEQVWSLQPLFLWQLRGGDPSQMELVVELYELDAPEPFWTGEPPNGATSLAYDGEPLEPGQVYEWSVLVTNSLLGEGDSADFEVMAADKRAQIEQELVQLEARLKAAAASPEAIALERANYFAARSLWSDALRELYSVENPSRALLAARDRLQANEFCN